MTKPSWMAGDRMEVTSLPGCNRVPRDRVGDTGTLAFLIPTKFAGLVAYVDMDKDGAGCRDFYLEHLRKMPTRRAK